MLTHSRNQPLVFFLTFTKVINYHATRQVDTIVHHHSSDLKGAQSIDVTLMPDQT